MKKTLLLVAAITATSIITFGQTNKIWNVGNDATNFPVSSGIASGSTVVVDGLSITSNVGGTAVTNMATVEANEKSFTSPTTSVVYPFINRFKFNGGGYEGAADTQTQPTVNMPTKRYLSFQVNGNSTIYAIGVTGSSASSRKIFVTNGTTLIGSLDFPGQPTGTPPLNEAIVNYTGPAATLYLYCNSAVNLYYLTATNVVTTGLNTVNSGKKIVEVKNYDILGKQISDNSQGMVIQKITYDDGSQATNKKFVKTEK